MAARQTNALLNNPRGIYADGEGDLYIADTGNNVVREVSALTGLIQIVAGTGTAGFSGDGNFATQGELSAPAGVFVDRFGNVFIADTANNRIREVVSATGFIQTVAGNGTAGYTGDNGLATSAELKSPSAVAVDIFGNIFIADTGNNVIREVSASTHDITTFAGNGTAGYTGDHGAANVAELNAPGGVALDAAGDVFIGDTANNVVREVAISNGQIQTVAGTGTADFSGDGGARYRGNSQFSSWTYGKLVGRTLHRRLIEQPDSRSRVVGAGPGRAAFHYYAYVCHPSYEYHQRRAAGDDQEQRSGVARRRQHFGLRWQHRRFCNHE